MLVVFPAMQAGILQGEVSNLMVLDQWQASLMRSLAELQLRQDQEARQAISSKFDMEEADMGADMQAADMGADTAVAEAAHDAADASGGMDEWEGDFDMNGQLAEGAYEYVGAGAASTSGQQQQEADGAEAGGRVSLQQQAGPSDVPRATERSAQSDTTAAGAQRRRGGKRKRRGVPPVQA